MPAIADFPPFLRTLLPRAWRKFQADRCTQLAAAISYYVVFSLFPLLIFIVSVSGLLLTEGAQQHIVNRVLDVLPFSQGEGRSTVFDAVHGVTGGGGAAIGLLGLIAMAWSGSAMFGAIRNALNTAFGDEAHKRPFAQQKLLDLALVLALAVFLIASLAATAFLRIVRNRSEQIAGWGDLASSLGLLWDAFSYLLPLVFSFVAFAALYSLVPGRRRRLGEVWPGALVAGLVFEGAKFGFSIYLEHFSNYNVVFGSLGAVAAFLFWLYLTGIIMLFGAEVAAEYPKVRAGAFQQPPLAGMALPLRQKVLRTVRGLFVRQDPGGAPR